MAKIYARRSKRCWRGARAIRRKKQAWGAMSNGNRGMNRSTSAIKHDASELIGRGAVSNPKNRFEKLEIQLDPGEEGPLPRTVFLRDDTQTLITYNDSPDVPFNA